MYNNKWILLTKPRSNKNTIGLVQSNSSPKTRSIAYINEIECLDPNSSWVGLGRGFTFKSL